MAVIDDVSARGGSLGSPAPRSVLDLQQQALLLAHREAKERLRRRHGHRYLGY